MIVGWLAAAWAHERDPLPALWVERPLLVPRGWCTATLAGERTGRDGQLGATLRYGVAPRVELRAGLAAAGRGGGGAVAASEIGGRWSLVRREPPNTSVAVDLSWDTPGGEGRATGLAARQFGPVLATAWFGAVARREGDDGGFAGLHALVQLGPLAALGGAAVERAGAWRVDAVGGGGVQLTRGVGAVATASSGGTGRVAVEVAW